MRPRARSAGRPVRAVVPTVVVGVLMNACLVAAPPFPRTPGWDAPDSADRGPETDEQKLWDEARKSVAKLVDAKQEYADAGLTAYLAELVERIAPPLAERGPQLSVRVMRDAERNAFALPDGTILITLTLLASLRNEAQIAFVMAHEIVHVSKRHTLLSSRYDALTGSHVERMRFSRKLEAEADRGAIQLMARAGYAVDQAAPALANTDETDPEAGDENPAWRSHADLGQRLAVVRVAVAAKRGPRGLPRAEPFESALDAHRLTAASIDLEAARYDEALALVNRHLERSPRSGPAYVLRARITGERDPKLRGTDAIGEDLERAVELSPDGPDGLRALGLFLRDTGQGERSRAILRRYLEARPDAFDRKIIERYVAPTAG
jgi:tetratricopeptide (TPR) repeat protein